MKILERTSIMVAMMGFLMKALIVGGANELLEMSLTLLTIIYFYLGFAIFNDIRFRTIFKRSSYSNINRGRIIGAIGLGISFAMIMTGLLFKLLVFTGANEMLSVGDTSLFLTLFTALLVFILKRKEFDSFYQRVFVKGGVVLIIGVIIYFTPTSALIRFFHRDDPAYSEIFVRAIQHPYDEKIQKEFEEARDERYGERK